MRKQKLKFPVKFALAAVVLLCVIFFLRYAAAKLQNSSYFIIRDIISNENQAIDLSGLKGRNIFSVDLDQKARNLAQRFPDYKKIRIIRIFPDRLYADFVKRIPLAYVKLYRFFYVDSDAVLFDPQGTAGSLELPVITGLDTKIFGPKPGTRYNTRELRKALDIIKEAASSKGLKDYALKKIDMSDYANTALFFSVADSVAAAAGAFSGELLEVKIGPDYIGDKINILGNLLSQVNSDRFNIKYIDLRFKEPVIKLKESAR